MAVPSGPAVAVGRRVRARCDAASVILQRSPRRRLQLTREFIPAGRESTLVDAVVATPPQNAGPRRTNEDAFHEGETFFGVYDGHSGAISASRGAAVPSRHRRASSPGEEVVGGFFFDFEAIHAPRR